MSAQYEFTPAGGAASLIQDTAIGLPSATPAAALTAVHAMPATDMPFETLYHTPGLADRSRFFDGIDTHYDFERFPLDLWPDRANVVYALASHDTVLFVGAADDLRHALDTEAPLGLARRRGARFLLIHTPAPADFQPHTEAARRLCDHLDPPLNR
ncbi:MAG: hypothetical protein AAGI34_06445 [Pseudomonadota bacterium]